MLWHDASFCSIDEVFDNEILHSRAPFIARTQQCFAVKAGVDGFLDVARKTFCETSEGANVLGAVVLPP